MQIRGRWMTNLTRVSIKQFRAYEDVEVIFNEDKGVVLMSGDNGSGKSTLLNAICWCLYADTPFYSVEDSDEIINKHAPQDSKITVQVEVKIDGNTYVFERNATREAKGGVLNVQREHNGNWEQLEPISGLDAVNKFLPKDIRHLFIFNGEQIAGIFKPDNDKGLKTSIYKVSELEILDKAKLHLATVEAEILNEITKSSRNQSQIDKLKQDRIITESEIFRKEEEIKIFETKIAANKVKFDELDEIASKTASARESKLLRDQLVENLEEIDTTLKNLEFDKAEQLQQNFHKALLREEFTDYVKILEQAEKDSILPPPIKPEVTNKILESGICICGREVHDEEIKFIKAQHEKNENANELSYLIGALFIKSKTDDDISDSWYFLSETYKEIADKTKIKEQLQKKIYEYNEILDKVNIEHDNPLARRNEILEEMNVQRSAKTRSEVELDRLRKTRRETEDMLKKIIDKDDNTKALETKRLHVQKLIDQVSDLKAEMEESIREKLTNSVSEIFFSILPNTVFKEIRIDSNYSLTLHSDDGREYLANNLSTGQAKALGLSLAYGLSKDMGYASTPMLIDNLYGDIKDTHFEDVTHMIEALSKNKQVVVMDLNINKSLPLFSPDSIKQTFTISRLKSEFKTIISEGTND
jgi:DNA sulfur modification protein DndD